MPAIDLSVLNVMELRRLSGAARARGDGVLADQVDWEIAARKAHGDYGHAEGAPIDAEAEPPPAMHDMRADDEALEEVKANDAPPAFARLAPEPARPGAGAWRSAVLVMVGVAVGGAVTGLGFTILGRAGWREPPRAMAAREVPPPSGETFDGLPKAVAPAPERPMRLAPPRVAEAAPVAEPRHAPARRRARTAQAPADVCAGLDPAAEGCGDSEPPRRSLPAREPPRDEPIF